MSRVILSCVDRFDCRAFSRGLKRVKIFLRPESQFERFTRKMIVAIWSGLGWKRFLIWAWWAHKYFYRFTRDYTKEMGE